MTRLSPATADLLERLDRYRRRMIDSDRPDSAAIVEAAIADVRAAAEAERAGPKGAVAKS